jgi:hypothetical protein
MTPLAGMLRIRDVLYKVPNKRECYRPLPVGTVESKAKTVLVQIISKWPPVYVFQLIENRVLVWKYRVTVDI